MHLIIGGAYQGKLEIAKEKYGITEKDIYVCTSEDGEIQMDAKCLYHVEKFVLYCVNNNLEAKDVFMGCREKWENSVIICEDIFCGIVPISDEMRAMREMTGRLCIYLANEATGVSRVFCGLEQVLK